MATVARYIYSHYEPQDREALLEETGQKDPENTDGIPSVDAPDPWQTESASFGTRRMLRAPRFVPASTSADVLQPSPAHRADNGSKDEVVSWYRSLARRTTDAVSESSTSRSTSSVNAEAGPSKLSEEAAPAQLARPRPPTKQDWFIQRALAAIPPIAPQPAPTLSSILARDPPPSSTDRPFTPPVFLALGPSNRGFAMLNKQGWQEGEALGPNAARLPPPRVKREIIEVKEEDTEDVQLDDDIVEVRRRTTIDLTLSDDDGDSGTDNSITPAPLPRSSSSEPSTHIALLTPLPTVLKADRLGIGLKAKTEGPYRASKKRVTHNAAAVASHVAAAEALRREKMIFGRGKRGFARVAREEREKRMEVMRELGG